MLKDKVIVVTGGAGLLGKQFCKEIISNGGIAIIADISEDLGVKAQIEIDPTGSHSLFVLMDITSKESISSAIKQIHSKYGKINALVNNAYPRTKNWCKNNFYHLDFEDFCENMRLQLGGYVLTSQQFVPYFKEQGGGL